MKTETTFIILFFFSGVFMSVVSAKPSPELMKELTALEKYLENNLERKERFDWDSVLNEIQGEQKTGNSPNGEGQDNNEVGDISQSHSDKEDADADKNKKPTEPIENELPANLEADKSPGKPNEDVPTETVQEGSGTNDQDSTSNGREGEEKKPQENNKVDDSNEEKERDKLFNDLNKVASNLKDAIDQLPTLINRFRQEFKNDDDIYNQLKQKYNEIKEQIREGTAELIKDTEDLKSRLGQRDAPGEKSVHDNSASRKRQLSDTEFLNIVQSLLTKN